MQDIKTTVRMFFDSPAVTGAVSKTELAYLKRYGAYARKVAQRSMRSRKKPSSAGDPPSAHGAKLLKRFLFFSFDPSTRSVVVGPAQLSGRIKRLGIPRIMEEGGMSPAGPIGSATVYVRPRPYMLPAKRSADAAIPASLRDSVKG